MLPGLASLAGFAADTNSSFWVEPSVESVSKTGSTSGGPKTLTTSNVTVIVHGGSGSPTFAWARTSGSSAITATNPTAATTAFSATVSSGQEVGAQFTCTVTDGSGAIQTAVVDVSIDLIGYA
jgi:hypothetical protein